MKNIGRFATLIHIVGLGLVFMVKAHGQTAAELTCKAQAKDIAVQTYQTCVTESRQQQMDTLRKEYQQKLLDLKDHYNKELKKASGKETDEAKNEESTITMKPTKKIAATKVPRGEKGAKGLARTLPKKQMESAPALPIQAVNDDVKVVPSMSDSDSASADPESAPAQEMLNN